MRDPKETFTVRAPVWPVFLPLVASLSPIANANRHYWKNGGAIDSEVMFSAAIILLLFASFVITWVSTNRSRGLLTMDRRGLWVPSLWGFYLPWSEIEGCAACNDYNRRILRLFLRKGARLTPLKAGARRSARLDAFFASGGYVDIDLRAARKAREVLPEAFAACQLFVGAAHRRAAIRTFDEEAPPRKLPTELTRRHLMIAALLLCALTIVAFVALRHLPATVAGPSAARPLIEEAAMPVDARPEQKILFLGNSRIFTHDVPRMVRAIADSAGSPIRYDIHMRAWADATFREHWNSDGDQAALRTRWDLVVLQTHSSSFGDDDSIKETADYGQKLIAAAKAAGSPVALIENWTLGEQSFSGGTAEWRRGGPERYSQTIAEQTRALAERAGASRFDLNATFNDAGGVAPDQGLTTDGNHLTEAGAYLAALTLYGDISGADVLAATYRPAGVDEATAAKLRAIAAHHVRLAAEPR